VAALLIALATLPIFLSTTLAAKTEPHPVEEITTDPTVEQATEPSPRMAKKTEKSDYEKLKLIIEKPAKKPAQEPAPTPEQSSGKELNEHFRQAGAASASVLPGPAQKAPTKKAPTKKAPEQKAPKERPHAAAKEPKPRDTRLLLSIPRLGLENVTVRDSPDQTYLDREGLMHLSGTGFPYERGSNTYIAGHANYNASRIPSIFRNLHNLRRGDLITLRDAAGKTYDYRVYERFAVTPHDYWVTEPIPGKNVVSLQTCFPAPTFEKRLIVRGELVK
jgi:sortase A